MSAQLIELIFFAGIAFLLLNRLVSMLGTTEEDDPARRGSAFGEPNTIKDVTEVNQNNDANRFKAIKDKSLTINEEFIAAQDNHETIKILENIAEVIPGFTLEKFLKGAKTVFKMIIKALKEESYQNLTDLVDKRYVDQIPETRNRYKNFEESSEIDAKVSEALTFGNSVIIKVLFTSKNLKEEWTFQRSLLSTSPDWYLANTEAVE
ncbi:MAG: hypothetical protein K0Q51_1149 [Rickettsiaceae bacterium]|jgi:predicted lipid-binding transport protein (Tim44 family)|nr:hypothetical protein [Rickettsiaceae bacterium]